MWRFKDLSFVKLFKLTARQGRLMVVVGGAICAFIAFLIIFGDFVAPYDPYAYVGMSLEPPSYQFVMGTDSLGRDIFSRVLVGSRVSLLIAAISVGISLSIGSILGAISGYVGGLLDKTLTAVSDSLYTFPTLILAILISAVLGPGYTNTGMAIGIPIIPAYFRVIRGITLSVKERGFIEGEKVLGNSPLSIIFRHIAPFYTSTLIVMASMSVSGSILSVAGLGFIGLGIPPPSPEWGSILAGGSVWLLSGKYWIVLFPGIMIFITILGFSLLSEGLDLVYNQRERRMAMRG